MDPLSVLFNLQRHNPLVSGVRPDLTRRANGILLRNQAKVESLRTVLGLTGPDLGDISQADYEAAEADRQAREEEDMRRKQALAAVAPGVAGEYGLQQTALTGRQARERAEAGNAQALALEQAKAEHARQAQEQQQGFTRELLGGTQTTTGGGMAPTTLKPAINAKGQMSFTSVPVPQQVLAQQHAAQIGLSNYQPFRQIIDALDQSGQLGPVAGRAGEALTSTGLSQYLMSPQNAKNFNDFKSMASLVKSNLALVHGGARGGGSPEIAKRFDQLINPHMSASSIKGALDAFERWQTKYASAQSSADLDQADLELGVSPSPARAEAGSSSSYLTGPGWERP